MTHISLRVHCAGRFINPLQTLGQSFRPTAFCMTNILQIGEGVTRSDARIGQIRKTALPPPQRNRISEKTASQIELRLW